MSVPQDTQFSGDQKNPYGVLSAEVPAANNIKVVGDEIDPKVGQVEQPDVIKQMEKEPKSRRQSQASGSRAGSTGGKQQGQPS